VLYFKLAVSQITVHWVSSKIYRIKETSCSMIHQLTQNAWNLATCISHNTVLKLRTEWFRLLSVRCANEAYKGHKIFGFMQVTQCDSLLQPTYIGGHLILARTVNCYDILQAYNECNQDLKQSQNLE
jgi:hypothetical protein